MLTERVNEAAIFASFKKSSVTALLGPRRVGKTTLVSQYVAQDIKQKWIFLNMDSWEERDQIEHAGLSALIQERAEQLIGVGEKIGVAIDEAQKCPALFDQIKILYDKFKDKQAIKFILTGSGHLSLHQLSAESLAGRIELFYLREFSLRETMHLKNTTVPLKISLLDLIYQQSFSSIEKYITQLAPYKKIAEKTMLDQIVWGGLPEMLDLDQENKRRYIGNYLQTYLEKDIRALAVIADVKLYHQMMGILAEQTGSIRSDDKIKTALSCARDTLKKYRGYLEATLLYQEIYPFVTGTFKRLVKTPKGYLLNNALISYLTGIDDLATLKASGLIGHRFENWVLKEIFTSLDRCNKHHEIYYWRTSTGIEVDFIVEIKPYVFPFEITFSSEIDKKKIRNLISFMENEARAKVAFYVYNGEFLFDKESGIYFIPAWSLG